MSRLKDAKQFSGDRATVREGVQRYEWWRRVDTSGNTSRKLTPRNYSNDAYHITPTLQQGPDQPSATATLTSTRSARYTHVTNTTPAQGQNRKHKWRMDDRSAIKRWDGVRVSSIRTLADDSFRLFRRWIVILLFCDFYVVVVSVKMS
jgi:hypothetical protein